MVYTETDQKFHRWLHHMLSKRLLPEEKNFIKMTPFQCRIYLIVATNMLTYTIMPADRWVPSGHALCKKWYWQVVGLSWIHTFWLHQRAYTPRWATPRANIAPRRCVVNYKYEHTRVYACKLLWRLYICWLSATLTNAFDWMRYQHRPWKFS